MHSLLEAVLSVGRELDLEQAPRSLRDTRPAARPRRPEELRRGGVPDGSMGPKAEAAARFVERTGGLVAISALDAAYEIVHGRSSTLIRPNLTGG